MDIIHTLLDASLQMGQPVRRGPDAPARTETAHSRYFRISAGHHLSGCITRWPPEIFCIDFVAKQKQSKAVCIVSVQADVQAKGFSVSYCSFPVHLKIEINYVSPPTGELRKIGSWIYLGMYFGSDICVSSYDFTSCGSFRIIFLSFALRWLNGLHRLINRRKILFLFSVLIIFHGSIEI